LSAAVEIAVKEGIKALTQPRVAKTAGVRQSHLTYYFPRKADLLAAVLEASHRHGEERGPETLDQALKLLESLIFDPNRMRFFLGAVVEAGEDEDLRDVLAQHAQALCGQIAPFFHRSAEDPAIVAFIDQLRGMGVRRLLEPGHETRLGQELMKLASECGLT
jgi:AcrR family transcriptional regulator